jgi:hypothetical protein
VLAVGFDHLLDVVCSIAAVADEHLNLVQDDKGERESAIGREGVLDGTNHLVGGDVLDLWKLGNDAIADADRI